MHHYVTLPGTVPGIARKPFSDAVRAGDTLYVSGCIGLDADGKPPADVAAEARTLMETLRRVLEEAGMSLADLVMVTIFASDVADFAPSTRCISAFSASGFRRARSSARGRSYSGRVSS